MGKKLYSDYKIIIDLKDSPKDNYFRHNLVERSRRWHELMEGVMIPVACTT
ncbi:MAG: hypothetical protein ACKO96_36360 [Flammeovirgaceae bacterium]